MTGPQLLRQFFREHPEHKPNARMLSLRPGEPTELCLTTDAVKVYVAWLAAGGHCDPAKATALTNAIDDFTKPQGGRS